MDLFEKWLNKKAGSGWVKRALTDVSYTTKSGVPKNTPTNKELATYGDAIIKLCYAEIFLDKFEKLSTKIEDYIGDKRFVTVIAKHYELLKPGLIDYDNTDPNMVKVFANYSYEKPLETSGRNKKESPDKRKATVVEAMIGAIYKETQDLEAIKELLNDWVNY